MAIITTDYGLTKPPPGCQIDYGDPINQGLVGLWLFNEKSGSRLTDYSGYGNHGTLTNFGMTGATSNWVGSPFGGCLNFVPNNYIALQNPWSTVETKYSISTWVYTNTTASSGQIFNWKNTNTVHINFQLDRNGATFRMIVGAGAANLEVATTGTIVANKWYHLVGVRDNNTTLIYLNGILAATDSSKTIGTITGVQDFVIGVQSFLHDNGFSGNIDISRLYNRRALNLVDVNRLYSQPLAGILSPNYYTPS